MKNKLIILRGLPWSGKTKYAQQFVETHPNFRIVSRDKLLNMMGSNPVGWLREVELANVDLLLCNGNWVIIDSVNESETKVNELKEIAEMNDVDYVVMTFKTPLPVCIENSKMKLGFSKEKIVSLFDNYFKRLYA